MKAPIKSTVALLLTVVAISLIPVAEAAADKLILKNGRVLEGQVSESGDNVAVINDDGVHMFSRGEVERIERDLLNRVDPSTRNEFVRTRALALRQETPEEAIAVWEAYVEKHPDGKLLPRAREEIDRLKEADEKGLVLWAGELVTPAERDAARSEAAGRIREGIRRYRLGEYGEARRTLREADRLWPNHPTVQFYRGHVLRRLRDPRRAARRFTDVLSTLPEHVPSLNNAACLCARLSDVRSGIRLMARALRREPNSNTLANNAWEILHLVDEIKQGPVVRADLLDIAEADVELLRQACLDHQRRLLEEGKARWGSEWVTVEQYKKRLDQRQEIKAQLKHLRAEARRLAAEIEALEDRMETLLRLKRAALQIDAPETALRHERELRDLRRRRGELQRRQARNAQEIKELAGKTPREEWTGAMILMDAENPREQFKATADVDEAIRRAVLSGKAELRAADGTFLGRINSRPHDLQSIWNTLGPHGSAYSEVSVFDPKSPHGSPDSQHSAVNPSASEPPALTLDGERVAYVTANPDLSPRIALGSLVEIIRQRAGR